MPMPPTPPADVTWLLSQPEPRLTSTGDPKVDAYRDTLLNERDSNWRPIFRRLLANVKADPTLIKRYDAMRAIDTPSEYIRHYVTPKRIAKGRTLYRAMKGKDPSGDGTPLELKLALWGALSDYGERPDMDLLSAMLTLAAYDRLKHPTFFSMHEAALLIAERKVERKQLRGYDSGKLGDIQYTPDFYTRLARDGDGDGKVDVWNNRKDILANLWIDRASLDGPLIIAVKPHNFDAADRGQSRLLRAMDNQPIMVTYFTRWDGKPWTGEQARYSGRYAEPFGKTGPAFLLSMAATPVAFRDPYAEGYNVDENGGFALAVLLLAEKIAGRPTPNLALMTKR